MQPDQIRTPAQCRALQAEIRELRLAVDNRRQENAHREEAIQQLTQKVSDYRARIDALTRTSAAETSQYQQSIDGLHATICDKDDALRVLHEKMEADNNVIQSLSREQDESRDIINSLLTTINEQNVLIEDYFETIIVLTHQVEEHQ